VSQKESVSVRVSVRKKRVSVRVGFEEKVTREISIALALALTLALFQYPEQSKVATPVFKVPEQLLLKMTPCPGGYPEGRKLFWSDFATISFCSRVN